MQVTSGITDIAHGIQLAVAPVFLLSAVGTTLAVLTNRLARIVDRARSLETALPSAGGFEAAAMQAELSTLARRAKLIHRAITLSTSCALLISLVIVALFAGILVERELSALIVLLFIAGLCAFIGALVCFLMEIRAATGSLHFAPGPK